MNRRAVKDCDEKLQHGRVRIALSCGHSVVVFDDTDAKKDWQFCYICEQISIYGRVEES